MNNSEFDDFVKNRYCKEIEWYDKKSISYKKYYVVFQALLLVFSSLTPVLIAIDFGITGYSYLKWVAVITAVIVAITSSSLRIFKFHDNWTTYRSICETLKKEINFYNAGIDEYANCNNKESLFVSRVENLISKEHSLWKTYFKKEST